MSETIEVLSAVHGIAPRSGALLKLGGDVTRGRASPETYDEQRQQEEYDWLELQVSAGIDLAAESKLTWQDQLRPLTQHASGFAPDVDNAPVTRWFQKNKFYRKPTITGPLSLNAEAYFAEVGEPGEYVDIIAPHSFAALSDNQSELPAPDNVETLYEQLVSALVARQVKRIVFRESSYGDPRNIIHNYKGYAAAHELAYWHPEVQFTYLTPGTSAVYLPTHWPDNISLGANLETYQALQRNTEAEVDINGRELWHQVVEGDDTDRDDVDVQVWPRDFLLRAGLNRLVLTHTADFEDLPLGYAQEKVKHLGELANQLREWLEGATI